MLTLFFASFVVSMGAIVVWGAHSAWPWIVAALAYQGLEGLREGVYGAEWQARAAGLLTVLGATALMVVIINHNPLTRPLGARAD